jgi:orotate phosphoribosyltransferase
MVNFDSIATTVIINILAASGILAVADFCGFLPRRLSKWLNKNKLSMTIEVLRELGIDPKVYKKNSFQLRIPQFFRKDKVKGDVIEALTKLRINSTVKVGSVNVVKSAGFIDLMGAASDAATAELYAKRIATTWRELSATAGNSSLADANFIVASKAGSPTIAYELSKIMNMPLVLHNPADKFKSEDGREFQAVFDTLNRPPGQSVGILIDDSTTGGAKVSKAIDDLRFFGYRVDDMIVVFEPKIKDARGLLASKNVSLHSIVEFQKDGSIN